MSEGNMVCEGWWPWILVQCKTWDDLRSSLILHWSRGSSGLLSGCFVRKNTASNIKGTQRGVRTDMFRKVMFTSLGDPIKTKRWGQRGGEVQLGGKEGGKPTKRHEKTGGMTRVLLRVPRWRGVVNSIQVVRHVDQACFMMVRFKENIFDKNLYSMGCAIASFFGHMMKKTSDEKIGGVHCLTLHFFFCEKHLPSWELTYPLPKVFWRWFSYSQVGYVSSLGLFKP